MRLCGLIFGLAGYLQRSGASLISARTLSSASTWVRTFWGPQEAARKARAIIEAEQNARVRSVEELVSATNAFDAAEQAVKDAAPAHDKAWSAALAAAWTEKNLREIGARAPGQSAPRARKRRAAAAPPAQNIEG
jgi:hypothetical protein